MLTATYSLVAITAEQDNARNVLRKLQQCIQNIWHSMQQIDFAFLDETFNKLFQFDEYCHHRKLELYVIPALHKSTREVDALLAELDALSESGIRALGTARNQLVDALEAGSVRVHDICLAMELYCDHWLRRLTKEEEELFPMLRCLLSVEEWFAIASQFLADDADTEGRRRHALPLLSRPLAAAAGSSLSAN